MIESVEYLCGCGQKLRANLSRVGQPSRCPKCQASVVVPFPEAPTTKQHSSDKKAAETPHQLFVLLGIFGGFILCACVIGIFGYVEGTSRESHFGNFSHPAPSKPQQLHHRDSVATESLPYSESSVRSAVELIKKYDLVRDAAILRRNDSETLNLALIVSVAINENHAQDLGDSFMRLAISSIEGGPNLGKEIGRSQWSYVVQVNDTSGNKLLLGAKDASARTILW